MKDKSLPKEMLLAQVEEALEERQNSDRRKTQRPLPPNVMQDRRKRDRRAKKDSH